MRAIGWLLHARFWFLQARTEGVISLVRAPDLSSRSRNQAQELGREVNVRGQLNALAGSDRR
jgi:hypothetical protein